MAKLYKSDGKIEEVKPKHKKWSLEEMQKHVGGYIEYVPRTGHFRMIANEEGRRMNLPYNDRATRLWRSFGHIPGMDQRLFGNVLVLDHGDHT